LVKEISLAEFISDVQEGLIKETVFIGNTTNRIYGKSVKGMADKPDRYELVWAKVP